MRGVFGILKIAADPLIGAVEQCLIHPLEVERQRQRLAHPTIAERRLFVVDGQPGGIGRRLVRRGLFDNLLIVEIAAAILGRPLFGGALLAQVERARLKGFEGDIIVKVVVVAQRIEIEPPAVHRQIRRPVIFHPAVLDILTQLIAADAVGAAGERRGAQRLVELFILPVALRQHRQRQQPQH